jgi:hypothetical protein
MVFTEASEFANGLGLNVHIRTKLVRYWSYIKSTAIRIGNDILEIEGTTDASDEGSEHYWINHEYDGKLDTLGGFPISMTP